MNDFSKKIVNLLLQKEVTIIGSTAVPAFEGDQYFSGTAYKLNAKGQMLIRTYSQVKAMALSSWMPETDTELAA